MVHADWLDMGGDGLDNPVGPVGPPSGAVRLGTDGTLAHPTGVRVTAHGAHVLPGGGGRQKRREIRDLLPRALTRVVTLASIGASSPRLRHG